MTESDLPTFTLTVKPEWIDHNGHMNVAYYVLAFDLATDEFYDTLGMGFDYADTGYSIFTLCMNVDYLHELFEGEEAVVRTHLLDADRKRVHYIHSMFHGRTNAPVATNECLAINVELEQRRSAPFPAGVQARIDETLSSHSAHEPPPQARRTLAIRR